MTNVIEQIQISATVNGEKVSRLIEPRLSLVDFLRNELELTGSHVGCEHGVCGACTVRVNGEIVRGCLMLAIQANGAEIMTIEGESDSGEIADLQKAFHERNALQCGFCTPGMLMTTTELLEKNPDPSRAEIREYLSGNYCRCTGYEAIVDAIETVAAERRGG
ncbi:MAG: (2Fe-2S)-binding protein [Rhodospirillaceae bacterium]|jgi:aerobic carbon-monoxide dehydrogenase small subunit|nr:(2Fe-2S)-binding protein [Rhodospirillaceae bacterium]